MSKLFSSGTPKSEPPIPQTLVKKAPLAFFPAKGLGSSPCFGPTEDKGK